MAWQTPKTDWAVNPKNPVPEDFNRIEGNIDFLKGDIETKKGAIVNALNTVGLETELTDTHAQIASKITAANQGTKIFTPSTVNQPIPKGFHSGQGYVKGDANLVSENIAKGKSIFGVVGAHEFTLSAGDDYIIGESLEARTMPATTSYTLLKTIQVNYPGTIRVSFILNTGALDYIAYARIYINGSPVGVERSNGGSGRTYVEDVQVNAGDLVQIYGRRSTPSGIYAGVEDFIIKAQQPPITET